MNKDTTTRLRIAVLVRQFPNIVQTYVLNHILSLKRTGAQVLIIASERPEHQEIHPKVIKNSLLSQTLYIGAEARTLGKQLLSAPFPGARYLTAMKRIMSSNIWKERGIKYGLKAIMRAKSLPVHEIDIVHSHSLFSTYDFLFLKDVFRIPITTTFHGLVPRNVKMLEPDKIQAALDTGDLFFVNTLFARQQLLDFGCRENKIRVIPQGTDTADFPFKKRTIRRDCPIVLLSVGRLSVEKGFHIAVRAVARLLGDFPSIRYRIIGGGPEERNLTELVSSLGLQDAVNIYGSVRTDELQAHYADAHIFILPSIDLRDGSHTETQGVVLQEAQSSGIPVIASRTGGIPEVVKDGVTGLLFDQENESELAHLIALLIANPDIYDELTIRGRKDVEDNYSIEAVCNRLINAYNELLRN